MLQKISIFKLSIYQIIIQKFYKNIKLLSTLKIKISNGNIYQNIRMISEGSCDSAENVALYQRNKLHFKIFSNSIILFYLVLSYFK